MSAIVKFYRAYPSAIPPMPADKSALGSLPTGAFQYCEPIRQASSFGWYAFPPTNLNFRFNGTETFYAKDGQWEELGLVPFEEEFQQHWEQHAPPYLADSAPAKFSRLFAPGFVQIWTGLLVSSAPDWSILVRPPANVQPSTAYQSFEGIIETDSYGPSPLFMNIKLLATDREIKVSRYTPLLQVVPTPREAYSKSTLTHEFVETLEGDGTGLQGLSTQEWRGFGKTMREVDPQEREERYIVGNYAADSRKRAKTKRD